MWVFEGAINLRCLLQGAATSAFAIVLCGLPGFALGQIGAGQIEKRFEEAPPPKSVPSPLIPEFDGLTAPEVATEIRFVLQGVTIKGATVFSPDEFRSLYENRIETEIAVSTIYDIANSITEKYGDTGYSLSRAIVPEQEIGDDGIVQIQIVEGFIEDVLFEGLTSDPRGYFEYYKNKILAEKPVRSETLERFLLLADDLPGHEVRSVLRKSPDTVGAAILIVEVSDHPLFGSLYVDNRGTNPVGPVQIEPSLTFSNITGFLEETSIRYVNASLSNELHYFEANETILLHPEGTTLGFTGKYTKSDPGTAALKSIELETEGFTFGIELRHPLIRTRQRNLDIYGKFEVRESESLAFDQTLSSDSIRSVRVGLDFDYSDAYQGINQVIVEVSQGLEIFGANETGDPNASRVEGRPDYTKLTLDLSRTQGLGVFTPALNGFAVHAAATAQIAASPLLSSEECALGGSEYGRAYDPSAILGDHCLAGSVELRYQPQVEAPFDYV